MNLHYEIRICKKIYNRVTMTAYVKLIDGLEKSRYNISNSNPALLVSLA